jgi:hypothetical protein
MWRLTMKIYRVIDNGTHAATTVSLEELGRQFIRLSKKYQKNDWYWVDEEDVK